MGCFFNKKNENKDEKKKGQNFDGVLEDIMDIKTVQIKGEMLFSQTLGEVSDHYILQDKIQGTALSSIQKVTNRFSNCIRSMKKIKRSFIDLQEDEKNFMKEIAILRTLDHMAILKIYEFYQDNNSFYLIMEHCSEGDLFDKIQKEAPFNEYTACHIIYQVLSGIVYCHSNNIVHRDVKADCILIESSEVVNIEGQTVTLYYIRLSGFACARSFNKKKKLTKKIGTSYYIAPEVLSRNYNEKCDIWSVGVLLYVLLCGKPPFWGENDKEILDQVKIGKPEYRENEWKPVSAEGKKFVELLLTKQASNRPSAAEALQNEWFKKYLYKHPVSIEEVQDLYNNICTFKIDPNLFFQQASIAYMVHHLAKKEEIMKIKHFYNLIDNNGDGKMEYAEIVEGFKRYITVDNEKALMRIFKYIDQAHTGCIEYEEFIRACINKTNFLREENLRSTFELFIKSKLLEEEVDGEMKIQEGQEIPVQDFKSILGLSSKFSDKQWETIIKQVDKNGDGQIEFDEFKEMMELFISEDKTE